MIKCFCDKCGKELLWYGNIMQSNINANISTIAQQFNTDGYKTYDASSGQWLDLCLECKMKLQLNQKI